MSLFNHVGGIVPRKSLHKLDYSKTFTCDMGKLIPIMCDEVVPGDVFDIGNEAVIRFQPMVAPMLHEVNAYVHYFFVPYRLLWSDWENFITGGEDGQFTASIPAWTSNSYDILSDSLWDYLGLPMVEGLKINAFPKRAYKLIWNEYYRDQNLQDELSVDDDSDNLRILRRNWAKDYFTSSLPWQQRGVAPSLPIVGISPVQTATSLTATYTANDNSSRYKYNGTGAYELGASTQGYSVAYSDPLARFLPKPSAPSGVNKLDFNKSVADSRYGTTLLPPHDETNIGDLTQVNALNASKSSANSTIPSLYTDNIVSSGNVSYVDGSNFSSVNISDLRLAFQIQKWLERNARGGARYTEELRSHFGVAPRDERLQRPEYIGGSKSSIIVSEVLQTSATDNVSPQGNLAGHGLAADFSHVGRYRATEYGLIMGLLSVMPKLSYNSQGINRQWLRQTKYDYYWPEFANLSEQAIYESEIYATVDNNSHIFSGELVSSDFFGYQGRYDEMRIKHDMVCGNMRNEFSYWTMARDFDSAPVLNSDFVTCNPTKRIFAVENVDGLIVHFGNRIRALRPIPIQSEPGLIDHN